MRPWLMWSTLISAVAVSCNPFITPLSAGEQNSDWRALVSPDNSLAFLFLRGDAHVFSISLGGWGPNWGWVGLGSKEKADGDEFVLATPFEANKARGQVIMVKQHVWKSANQDISINYELSADKDVPLTMLIAGIQFNEKFQVGDILLKHRDGTEGTLPLTIGGPGAQPETGTLVFRGKAIGEFTATINPPLPIAYHGDLRVQLAADMFKAGKKSITITFHLPAAASLLARQADIDRFSKVLPDK